MEPKETHNNIEELLSAAYDGEVSEEEHALAEETINSPEWASHAAFLGILKDSARYEDRIEIPASLSERIAMATYARPTLWSRITAALRPAPVRYAAGGLALSGLAAIGLVMLRPAPVSLRAPTPATSPNAGTQLANNVKSTPDPLAKPALPDPKPTAMPQAAVPTPAPQVPAPGLPAEVRKLTPTITRKNDVTAPPVTSGHMVAKHTEKRVDVPSVTQAPPTPSPANTNIKKPTPLPPPHLAEPVSAPLPVATETPRPSVVDTGDMKGLTEEKPVVAEPRPATIASTSGGNAAIGITNEMNARTTPKSNPDAIMKISLNQGREKLNGLSAQAGAGNTSGNRMSLVSDNEKR